MKKDTMEALDCGVTPNTEANFRKLAKNIKKELKKSLMNLKNKD